MAKKTILDSYLAKIYNGIQFEEAAEKTQKIYKNAQEQNWPEDVWNSVTVVPKGEGIAAASTSKDSVLEYEYGTPSRDLSTVIRSAVWELN